MSAGRLARMFLSAAFQKAAKVADPEPDTSLVGWLALWAAFDVFAAWGLAKKMAATDVKIDEAQNSLSNALSCYRDATGDRFAQTESRISALSRRLEASERCPAATTECSDASRQAPT